MTSRLFAFVALVMISAPVAGATSECAGRLAAPLVVGEETYRPARELGSGLGGCVWQAHAADGTAVQIKSYHSWFKCRSDVRLYRRLKRENFDVLDVLAVDGWQKRVVFAYRRGLDLFTFRRLHALADDDVRQILANEPGLAEVLAIDAAKTETDYLALLARLKRYGYRELFYHPKNILVESATGRLVILDPT